MACYHRVLPAHEEGGPARPYFARGTAIRAERFEAQVRALRERFELIGEDEVLRRLRSGWPRPYGWLTFDDGHRDVLTEAAPILRRFGLPATVFVPTAILGATPSWLPADAWYAVLSSARARAGTLRGFGPPWRFDLDRPLDYARIVAGPEKRRYIEASADERRGLLGLLAEALETEAPSAPSGDLYLTAADLKVLRRDGWTVGAHGHSHALLTALGEGELAFELEHPRRVLASLGHAARTLAYPDGAWSPGVAAAARAAGYEAAVALASKVESPYALARQLMTDRM